MSATAKPWTIVERALENPEAVALDVFQSACDDLRVQYNTQTETTSPLLGLGQINPTPGNIAGNAQKILRRIQLAEMLGLHLVVFPELSLMGYLIEDVILRHPHLVEENLRWLEALAKETRNTCALVGFVEPRPEVDADGRHRVGKPYYNSVAILSNGKIQGIVRKSLLPNYAEFNDYRMFEPSNTVGVISADELGKDVLNEVPKQAPKCLEINGIQYGVSICEDIWNNAEFIQQPMYHQDPIESLVRAGADILINLSASPSRAQKEQMKHNLLSHTAARYKKPVVYVNQCGSVDSVNFDGASRVYDADGNIKARAKFFAEQFLIVQPLGSNNPLEPLPQGLEQSLSEAKQFDPTHAHDLARTYQSVLQGISDYFKKNNFKRAVLGLSGGLDSSVTAVLLCDALGADNVIGVSMPSSLTPDENKSDAQILAENLGMHFIEYPIVDQIQAAENFAESISNSLEERLGGVSDFSTGRDNVQAMMRALNLRRIGNDYRALPIATSDKSELYMGYATVNGDMSGALAPIGDIVKTKVRALAHWLNQNRNSKDAIPLRVIEKPSGADLKLNPDTGKLVTAEEDLMPYPFLDEAIWRLEFSQADFETLMATEFVYEKENTVSIEQKRLWLEKFYRLMSAAVFKWHIAPPVLIVDGYGITRTEYRRPIVAKLNPNPLLSEAIALILQRASLPMQAKLP